MKKLVSLTLALLVALCALAVPALAEGKTLTVGRLDKSNQSEEEFNRMMEEDIMPSIWYVYDGDHETHYQYFDDLSGMLLALNAGTIDEITLPRFAAEYAAAKNPDLEICCVQSMPFEMSLVFGFRDDEGGRDLQARINEAIRAMKADGALDALKVDCLRSAMDTELASVQFDAFPESGETIRVVVTGDLPPMDYIGADGVPAGFNTAVLAEIGRRLGINIELVSMQAATRTLALTSNTADMVFWFMDSPGLSDDMPEGLVFSQPYLSWDLWLHIRKAVNGE